MEDITEGGQGTYVRAVISTCQNLVEIIFIIISIFILPYNHYIF